MAFLDTVKKNIGLVQQEKEPLIKQDDEQAELQRLLQARKGKAAPVTTTVPKAQTVGQQQAQAQVKLAEQQIQQQGRQQAIQVQQEADRLKEQHQLSREQLGLRREMAIDRLTAEETIKINEMNNKVNMALQELATDKQIKVEDIMSNLEKQKAQLELDEYEAELEQAGFLLSLQDKNYVAEIRRAGEERNLRDNLKAEYEMTSNTFSQDLSLLMEALDVDLEAMEMEYDAIEKISELDLDSAMALSEEATRSSAITAAISGGIAVGKPLIGKAVEKDYSQKSTIERHGFDSDEFITPKEESVLYDVPEYTGKYEGVS